MLGVLLYFWFSHFVHMFTFYQGSWNLYEVAQQFCYYYQQSADELSDVEIDPCMASSILLLNVSDILIISSHLQLAEISKKGLKEFETNSIGQSNNAVLPLVNFELELITNQSQASVWRLVYKVKSIYIYIK